MSSASSGQSPAALLRAAQAPLKSQYKTSPSSAFVTLTSSGTLSSTNLTCSLSSSSAAASKRIAGLHSAAGGGQNPNDDAANYTAELCSGEMLLEALVACYGVTLRAVSTSMGIALKESSDPDGGAGSITAEGDLDFRGTLGIKDASTGEAVPVGIQAIRLSVRLVLADQEDQATDDGDRDKKVQKLLELSERYCVVLQTLRKGVPVNVESKLEGQGSGTETTTTTLPDVSKNGDLNDIKDRANTSNSNGEKGVPDEDVLPVQ